MMNQDGKFKKFRDDIQSNPGVPVGFPPPCYVPPPGYTPPGYTPQGYGPPVCAPPPCPPPCNGPPSIQMNNQMVNNCRRTKQLATVELVLSCILLLFGIISIILSANIPHPAATVILLGGTHIWTPVIGIITAGLGLGALMYGNYSRKCLLISHFIMSIISAMASVVLIIFASAGLANMPWILNNYRSLTDVCSGTVWCFRVQPGLPEALVAFEAFILIGAVAHMIASIVSTAFICRYWCGGKSNSAPTVLYLQNPTDGNGPLRTITVPAGSQVIFTPSNATIVQGPATLPSAPRDSRVWSH